MSRALPASIDETAALLAGQGYVADRALATTVHLSLALARPLLLEGEPGTGKTEIARVLAEGLGRRLVRLQCYDGMDLSAAAYEWETARASSWPSAWRKRRATRRPSPATSTPASICRPGRCFPPSTRTCRPPCC